MKLRSFSSRIKSEKESSIIPDNVNNKIATTQERNKASEIRSPDDCCACDLKQMSQGTRERNEICLYLGAKWSISLSVSSVPPLNIQIA